MNFWVWERQGKADTKRNFEESVPLSLGKGRADGGGEEGWVGGNSQSSGKRRGLKLIAPFLWGLESASDLCQMVRKAPGYLQHRLQGAGDGEHMLGG